MAGKDLRVIFRKKETSGSTVPVGAYFGEPFINTYEGRLFFSGTPGGTYQSVQGQPGVFEIGGVSSSGTSDVTRIQPGSNITTGGTGNFPIINVVDSPIFNSLTISGNTSVQTISATTIYSAGTNLYDIFSTSSGGTITTVSSTTIYVDGNRIDSYTEDGTIIYPYKTIQAAINVASANNSINIAPGTYTENLSVVTTITLIGDGFVAVGENGDYINQHNVTINGNITNDAGFCRLVGIFGASNTLFALNGSQFYIDNCYLNDVILNNGCIASFKESYLYGTVSGTAEQTYCLFNNVEIHEDIINCDFVRINNSKIAGDITMYDWPAGGKEINLYNTNIAGTITIPSGTTFNHSNTIFNRSIASIFGTETLLDVARNQSFNSTVKNILTATNIQSAIDEIFDVFAVQAGTNIATGGTSYYPIISTVDSPTFNDLTASGITSVQTLSATTLFSGSTNLYDIFSTGTVASTIQSKSFILTSPATAAASTSAIWRSPSAITINAVHVLCISGTSIVGNLWIYDSNGLDGTSVNSTDITGTSATNVSQYSLTNPSVSAGNYIGWKTTAINGAVNKAIISFEYT